MTKEDVVQQAFEEIYNVVDNIQNSESKAKLIKKTLTKVWMDGCVQGAHEISDREIEYGKVRRD